MINPEQSAFLIRIHPEDNVLVLSQSVHANLIYWVAWACFTFEQDLNLGHKIASRPIGQGEMILKYGVPIGSALNDISTGDHVHLHNMKSDYLPTYTLADGSKYGY